MQLLNLNKARNRRNIFKVNFFMVIIYKLTKIKNALNLMISQLLMLSPLLHMTPKPLVGSLDWYKDR